MSNDDIIVVGRAKQGMSCSSILLLERLHKQGYKINDLFDNKMDVVEFEI